MAGGSGKLVAIDLGSSGGRVYLGEVADQSLSMQEIHRFANGPVRLGERWYWDILRLWDEVKVGLRLAGAQAGRDPLTIGVDSFGVDYCLLDAAGALMAPPRNMRDARTRGLYPELYRKLPREALYRATGMMEIEINTALQLFAEAREQPWLHASAANLLFVPDFVAWALSGRMVSEVTIASTSQLLDPVARGWADAVIASLGIPRHLLAPLLEPASVIGKVLPALAAELGLAEGSEVVAVASHDTAAAVAATPMQAGGDGAFISLGTWSLLGRELAAPELGPAALRHNFTNECGAGGRIVFHKILPGLWLLQECRRRWAVDRPGLSYADIHEAAAAEAPSRFMFDVEDAAFVAPADMPAAIARWFTERDKTPPQSIGAMARAVYDSLALCYRAAIAALEEITGSAVRVIHVVGGGAEASVLCQATADATGRSVIAGPVEAAVAGNMTGQLIARGMLVDLEAGRALVRRSSRIVEYEPQPAGGRR
jgi:rhamnulokinase